MLDESVSWYFEKVQSLLEARGVAIIIGRQQTGWMIHNWNESVDLSPRLGTRDMKLFLAGMHKAIMLLISEGKI